MSIYGGIRSPRPVGRPREAGCNSDHIIRALCAGARSFGMRYRSCASKTSAGPVRVGRGARLGEHCCLPAQGFPDGCQSCRRSGGGCAVREELARMRQSTPPDAPSRVSQELRRRVRSLPLSGFARLRASGSDRFQMGGETARDRQCKRMGRCDCHCQSGSFPRDSRSFGRVAATCGEVP